MAVVGGDELKICYVTMSFPDPGEPFAGNDVRGLLRQGSDVMVYSLRPRHPRSAELVDAWGLGTATVHHNSVHRSLIGLLSIISRPKLLAAALRVLGSLASKPRELVKTLALLPGAVDALLTAQREGVDVLHAFWGHYPAVVLALAHRYAPEMVTSLFAGAYDLHRAFPVTRTVAPRADIVWTHAHANRDALLAAGAPHGRIRVAHRGIDTRMIPAVTKKIPGRIVTVGRLIPLKRMDVVLEAFRGVLAVRSGASLEILGDGPERARLEALTHDLGIEHAVRFAGHVSHSEVLEHLASAEVMILLSATERLPNAVKEAMACRCYCVVSDTDGIRELIPDRTHGVVVDEVEPSDVAAEVQAALEDPDRRERVGKTARAHVMTQFDSDRSMKTYVDAWQRALSEHRP